MVECSLHITMCFDSQWEHGCVRSLGTVFLHQVVSVIKQRNCDCWMLGIEWSHRDILADVHDLAALADVWLCSCDNTSWWAFSTCADSLTTKWFVPRPCGCIGLQYTQTPFWSVDGRCLCLFRGGTQSLWVFLDYTSPVFSWPTRSSPESWNLPSSSSS